MDDRHVISGIIHVLKSGWRWVDAPEIYGPIKTLYNRFVRWSEKGVWEELFTVLAKAGGPPAHVMIDSSVVKAHLSSVGGNGGKAQAIGGSRGGRTTKFHALTDAACRPLSFLLTGGQTADCAAEKRLLEELPKCCMLHAEKPMTAMLSASKSKSKVLSQTSRQEPIENCFSSVLYKDRSAIERMFCRIKDFRRIATRYDRNASNFLSVLCLVATICYWLRVSSLIASEGLSTMFFGVVPFYETCKKINH